MNANRKTAVLVGVLYLVSYIGVFVGGALLGPFLEPGYPLANVYSHNVQLVMGVLMELVNGLAVLGIGVLMFPLLRKFSPVLAPDSYVGGSIQVVDPESGKFETLYDACDGRKLRGPNDLVFDAHGGFWFTDLGKTRERDNDRGAVYYAKADGSMIREAIFPLERPNGCGLSPDGKTLYVVETPTARCWSFSLSAPGEISSANGPYRGEKGRVLAGLGGYQMFDSLAVDSEGHVCVATLVTGAVSDIWPDGSRVDQYLLPDPMVTNICFGGEDLRTAYATLSMTGRLVSFEWPRPGLVLNYAK